MSGFNTTRYFGVPPSEQIWTENRYAYTATAGQTIFPAEYTVGYVDVFYNGSHLDPTVAFTATDGHNVVLTTAASAGASVVIIAKPQVRTVDVYTKAQTNALLNSFYGVSTGTGDAMVVTTTPTFSSFADGMEIRVRAVGSNTLANPTAAFNGLAAKTIVRDNRIALTGGDYSANDEITLRYIAATDQLVLINGKLTAATPAQYDSSAKIATMAAVQAGGVRFASFGSISGNYTMALTDLPKIVAVQANGQTITLPPVTDSHIGAVQRLFIYPGTSNTVTIVTTAPQQLSTPTSLSPSLNVSANGFTDFVWEGTSTQHWEVSGAGVMDKSPAFGASLATNGYQKLPSGLIKQWGVATTGAGGTTTVTYPIAFPNQILQQVVSLRTASVAALIVGADGGTPSGFPIYASNTSGVGVSGITVNWTAVGW